MEEALTKLNKEERALFDYWFTMGVFGDGAWNTGERFHHLYFALLAIVNGLAGEMNDKQKFDWIKLNENIIRDAFLRRLESHDFIQGLEELKRLTPVRDSRKPEVERSISDVHNMAEVLDVIYMIRCNYAHGNKPDNDRNARLFEASSKVLKNWLEVLYTRGS